MNNNQVVQNQQIPIEMYNLLGKIDLTIRKLLKKALFLVGLTRVGKSTVYNYINNIRLIGERRGMNVYYGIAIENPDAAQSSPAGASVTLIPNILNRNQNGEEYSVADLAGYQDNRRYEQVVGVSYVLKAAFQVVEQCKFGLVVSSTNFLGEGAPTLFKSILSFINMFQYRTMSQQSRNNLLGSVTIIITKTNNNEQDVQSYAEQMQRIIGQINNRNYGAITQIERDHLTHFLTYFVQNTRQIYLFGQAQVNQNAPQCTIVEDHFNRTPYFKLAKENKRFREDHSNCIFKIPFNIENMPNVHDQTRLDNKMTQRHGTFLEMAKIMKKFFIKAIDSKNYFSSHLNLTNEFKQVAEFNKKYNVYPEYNFKQESRLNNVFSPGDTKKLETGIKLALNVFRLYERFVNLPDVDSTHQDQKLAEYMESIKEHLIKILMLFRDSFCSSYEQELLIQEFLFIGVRGCRQFSMLYQIKTNGRSNMCITLKNSFVSILNDNPLQDIQFGFIKSVYANMKDVIKNTSHTQSNIYLKYLKQAAQRYANVSQSIQFRQLKRQFLKKISLYVQSPEQSLLLAYQNLKQRVAIAGQKIEQLQQADAAGWQAKYPQENNFAFQVLLTKIGNILLDLQRPSDIKLDKFSYEMQFDQQQNVKQKLTYQQSTFAQQIFLYLNCVESVKKSYEIVIKNLPKQKATKKIEYYRGLAKYLSKHGRTQQAIIELQKAQNLCNMQNCFKQSQCIKKQYESIYTGRQDNLKIYFRNLKKRRIIDPSDDLQLQKIIQKIQEKYIKPYLAYKEKKELENQRLARKNQNQ